MKILYVDIAVDGHHKNYFLELINVNMQNQIKIIVPEYFECDCEQVIYYRNYANKKFIDYLYLMNAVKKEAKMFRPDIIHFLYGDYFYRFFGVGLLMLKEYKSVMTFHSIRRGKIHDLSLHYIFDKINMGIVHTRSLQNDLRKINIQNIDIVQYPYLGSIKPYNTNECKDKLNLNLNVPVLGVFGNTRHDKGLDLLLEALKIVGVDFQLLIAGKAEAFDADFINDKIIKYRNKVRLLLHYLPDEEMHCCVQACDIAIFPYRKIFDGASGPLIEAAFRKKRIIAPSHGSLAEMILEYNLGTVFEAENVESLAIKISEEIASNKIVDEVCINKFKNDVDPEKFRSSYQKVYQKICGGNNSC